MSDMREQLEEYYRQLRIRKAVLKNQLEQPEFQDMTELIKGEIKALDRVLCELKEGFLA